jgi:TolB-like protein
MPRLVFGPFVLDTERATLTRDGAPLAVGQRALNVLQVLAEAAGGVVNKASLIERAWPGLVVEESNLSVQIAALRKALGPTPDGGDWIVTVPRVGYRLLGDHASAHAAHGEARAPASRPSVAVLPFANLSGDASQDYFVDAITDDVIAALTRFRWFFVAGRSPSYAFKSRDVDVRQAGQVLGVRYVVRGSVRKAGERVRIAVELDDVVEDRCVWADHHDFDIVDVFTVQDQIAQRVAASIEPELLKTETGSAAAGRRGANLTAWDLLAQGCWYFHQVTQPTHLRARELFLQARALDPEMPDAPSWLARVDAGMLAFGWAPDESQIRAEGMAAALEAVRRDERNCYAHYSLAIVAVMSDAPELAISAAEKAIEVSPSFALGHLVLGMGQLYAGDPAGAQQSFEHGLRLNAHDPHNFVWLNALAVSHLMQDDAEGALRLAQASLKVRPQWRPAVRTVAACYAALGHETQAQDWREQLARTPPVAGDTLGAMWRRNPQWAARMAGWGV